MMNGHPQTVSPDDLNLITKKLVEAKHSLGILIGDAPDGASRPTQLAISALDSLHGIEHRVRLMGMSREAREELAQKNSQFFAPRRRMPS